MKVKAAYYKGNKHFSVETITPNAPEAGEVQIAVAYCGICGTDLHVYLGHMDARIGNHRVIGHEMSGTVVAVGSGVSDYSAGDRVVVRPLVACGKCPACLRGHAHVCQNLTFLGLDTDGAFQERWNVPAHTLHKIPDNLSLDEAALIEPVAVACHDVKRGNVQAGEDVLVIGGGPIGMLVALAAKNAGGKVTVSEINPSRLAVAEKLGMKTINPKETDAVETIMADTNNKGMDVVFEVSGTQPGIDLMTAAASVRGRIVMVAIHATKPEVDVFQFFWKELEMIGARVYEPADYDDAIALVADGGIPAKEIITGVEALANIEHAFSDLSGNPQAMKILIQCAEETPA